MEKSTKMKRYILLLIGIFSLTTIAAQDKGTLKLTGEQIEALFLKQNLELIANHLNVDIADAAISQAKLWDNPSLSIGDVNLWSTKNQREGEDVLIPPLFGSFAKNTQFSIELSQLIQTAGKRGKLVNREKVSKEIAIQEFEDVLRGLKVELRKSIYEIIYLQSYQKILESQNQSFSQLIEAYKRQVSQGNISRGELLRLESSLLELDNEINEVQTDLNEQKKNIKSLLNTDPLTDIEIEDTSNTTINPNNISLAELLTQAVNSRPDVKQSKLETQYHEKSLAYEKAMRVPDLTVSASYDRFGGVWKDFIGVGVSIDLPFLNRNQGNIKAARISKDQSSYLAMQQQNLAQHEVAEAFSNYIQIYTFYKKIDDNQLFFEMDNMLGAYAKNLLNRNISMLEYTDFMDSYKNNKQTILSARKKLNTQFEELQYTVGAEIK